MINNIIDCLSKNVYDVNVYDIYVYKIDRWIVYK